MYNVQNNEETRNEKSDSEEAQDEFKSQNIEEQDGISEATETENILDEVLNDPVLILEKEKQELKDAYLRLSAETDNYRKRIQQEKETFKKIALREVIEKLLPVIDNLERSIQAASNTDNVEKMREGVELILNQFENVLKDVGLEIVEVSCGDEFDPQCCEAVMMEERNDVEHLMTVLEVFETGRKLGGQVVRTAKVKVAKKI